MKLSKEETKKLLFERIYGESEDPCWDGYQQYGMKDKNGKEVPNCVPETEEKGMSNYDELKSYVSDFLVDLENNGVDYRKMGEYELWDIFREEINNERWSEDEFLIMLDKLLNQNQLSLFTEENKIDPWETIEFHYDNKGNFIPKNIRNKNYALRSVEQPIGSGKWRVLITTIDLNGNMDEIIDTKDNWSEAKKFLWEKTQNMMNEEGYDYRKNQKSFDAFIRKAQEYGYLDDFKSISQRMLDAAKEISYEFDKLNDEEKRVMGKEYFRRFLKKAGLKIQYRHMDGVWTKQF